MRLCISIFLITFFNSVFAQFNNIQFQKLYNSVEIREQKGISLPNNLENIPTKSDSTLDSIYHSMPNYYLKESENMIKHISIPLNNLVITSKYGMRFHPIKKKWIFHSGVDLRANQDTVKAILDGIVSDSGYDKGLGYYIKVQHNTEYITTYAHLSQYFHLQGAEIKSGQALGITGSTGLSTGEHLHFAVHYNGSPTDPLKFLKNLFLLRNTLTFNNNEKYRSTSISNP